MLDLLIDIRPKIHLGKQRYFYPFICVLLYSVSPDNKKAKEINFGIFGWAKYSKDMPLASVNWLFRFCTVFAWARTPIKRMYYIQLIKNMYLIFEKDHPNVS